MSKALVSYKLADDDHDGCGRYASLDHGHASCLRSLNCEGYRIVAISSFAIDCPAPIKVGWDI